MLLICLVRFISPGIGSASALPFWVRHPDGIADANVFGQHALAYVTSDGVLVATTVAPLILMHTLCAAIRTCAGAAAGMPVATVITANGGAFIYRSGLFCFADRRPVCSGLSHHAAGATSVNRSKASM